VNSVPRARSGEERDALQAQVDALAPWFHNVHLPHGVRTAPDQPYGDFPAFKWREIGSAVPADLSGWRVLDVGCNSGFYSVELARRGARVTAIDIDPHYLRQARWVAEVLGLEDAIEFRQMPVYQLAHLHETFDLVWFMGVLYHLRHPLLALDILRRRTGRLMVMQTMTMPGLARAGTPADLSMAERERLRSDDWPKMAFIEHRVENDPTNWWAPDRATVEAMLRSAGFRIRQSIADETWLCEADGWASDDERGRIDAELQSVVGPP
jgi:tRNA (mo5U34)-methyltransferase